MATGRGLGIVTDGLVFYYDTGNSRGSYKGEPTTNLLNNSILAAGNGATLGEDSFGTYIQLPDISSGYSRFQLPNISVSSNDVYTWSFELYTTETFSSGYSWDTNEYSDQYPNSNDLSRVTYNASTPSTISAGVWTPFRLTVTMKDGLTGAYTYDFFRFFFPQFQNKKVYYRNMQFEFKNHKTQYAGQGGSRSSTQGLLDISGQGNSIDISNASFDSNAQMTFDGTDDYVDVGLYHLSGSSHSEDVVIYRNATGGSGHGILSDLQYGFYGLYINSSNQLQYRQMQQNPGQTPQYPSVTITAASPLGTGYYHIVGVYSNDNGFQLYVNGSLEASSETILPFNLAGGRGINHIGVYKTTAASSYTLPFNGRIETVKAYNRALTASEVKRNYDALKTRFGLI